MNREYTMARFDDYDDAPTQSIDVELSAYYTATLDRGDFLDEDVANIIPIISDNLKANGFTVEDTDVTDNHIIFSVSELADVTVEVSVYECDTKEVAIEEFREDSSFITVPIDDLGIVLELELEDVE